MYIPRLIEAENLFSFKSLHYTFNNGVTTLVNGENRDNDSQESNGSGKSSLIEAVAIALTGSALRKVGNSEIINDSADEAFLRFTLDNKVLNETFIISRRFFRKSASIVSIQIFKDGKEIEEGSKLSSVDEYNKAILERIGLTRDEIFNNFTLSKYKYVNFLSVSDKQKKEIINRFSRGNAIDQAIEELEIDTEPIAESVDDIKVDLAVEQGKEDAFVIQLKEMEDGKEEAEKLIEEKINDIKIKLSDFKTLIREKKRSIKSHNKKCDEIDDIIADIESGFSNCADKTKEAQIDVLLGLITKHRLDYPNTFVNDLNSITGSVKPLNESIISTQAVMRDVGKSQKDIEKKLSKLRKSSLINESLHESKIKEFDTNISKLDKGMDTLRQSITSLNKKKNELLRNSESLSVKLAGSISCPKCNHVFLAADKDFNIDKAKEDINDIASQVTNLEADIKIKTVNGVNSKNEKESIEFNKKTTQAEFDDCIRECKKLQTRIESLQVQFDSLQLSVKQKLAEISKIDEKVEKFIEDSFNDVIDYVGELSEKEAAKIPSEELLIKQYDGSIINLNERLKDIEAGKDTDNAKMIEVKIKSIKKGRRKIESKLDVETKKLNLYLEQKQTFIDFKTHLANSKIHDLESTTNDFLHSIGSDLSVAFSGYTKLKSGKIRDKISIKLLRDGIDAGSFGKFSGGEQARISLANILALSKLINMNCDDGRGLDLLILDEILDATDGSGLACMLEALNNSKITCIMVSHGLVAEGYPYVQKVIKENDESRIEQLK